MAADAPPSPFSPRHAAWASAVILVGSAVLLFARLGHYALWDDEAITALTARSVWRTGDTSVRVDDHNLLLYRDGLLVKGFKDRFTPPLQFFLLAPVVGLLGDGRFACRLPFAACGLLTVGIGVRWLWRARPHPAVWWAAAALLLTNVEFFLFFRQCRYYGLAMLFTAAAAYLYHGRDGRTRGVAALSAVLALLLASQYLNYAAAALALVVDYAIWGRRRRPLIPTQWAVLLVPQLLVGGVVCSIWNPLARQGTGAFATGHWLADRLHLLWMNVRDAAACDFVVLPLLLACPVLYLRRRDPALLRLPVAIAAYLLGITGCVATVVAQAPNAEVRYLAPLVPLCVLVAVVAVRGSLALSSGPRYALWTVSLLSLFLNVRPDHTFSTVPVAAEWYAELIRPQAEPYTPAIAWVNAHVPPGSSVLVRPDYMTYPLMWGAPAPTYAWQLTDHAPAEYATLPSIHVAGRQAPDYVIAFGRADPRGLAAVDAMAALGQHGITYDPVATLPVYWQDFYRPELLWRHFRTQPRQPDCDVYVYRCRPEPSPATAP